MVRHRAARRLACNAVPRVLHIIDSLSDTEETRALLATLKSDDTTRHVVLTLNGSGRRERQVTDLGVDLQCLQLSRRKWRRQLRALPRMIDLIRRLAPDLVATWSRDSDVIGGLAARLAGARRIVWNIRSSPRANPGPSLLGCPAAHIAARLAHYLPETIVAPTETLRRDAVTCGYPPARLASTHAPATPSPSARAEPALSDPPAAGGPPVRSREFA